MPRRIVHATLPAAADDVPAWFSQTLRRLARDHAPAAAVAPAAAAPAAVATLPAAPP